MEHEHTFRAPNRGDLPGEEEDDSGAGSAARTAPFPHSHSPVASSRKIVFKEGNQMERGGGTVGYQVTPPQWRFFRAPFPASNARIVPLGQCCPASAVQLSVL